MFIEKTLTGVRAANAARMCRSRHGRFLGHPSHNLDATYYVVDGYVWLITTDMSVRFREGSYFEFCDEVRRGIRSIIRPTVNGETIDWEFSGPCPCCADKKTVGCNDGEWMEV